MTDATRTNRGHPLLAAFVAAGCSDVEIARHYRVSTRTVSRWRDAEGLPVGRRKRERPHGTLTRYLYGCRCGRCREANAEAQRRGRKARWTNGLPPGDSRHGTLNGARAYGCRCDPCKRAWREAYGEPKVPRWTHEEDAVIKDRTLTAKEAGERIGRTTSAVYHRRALLKRKANE